VVVRAVPDAVEAATRSQQLDEVADAFKRYESWVERFPHPTRLALLARCRALIDESGAERHYTDALSLDALPPFDRARTELLYGEWLRRGRRRIDARVRLRSALETFEQLGVTPWAGRARAELRASGETARRRDPATRDQLTPQELRIAGLAAPRADEPRDRGPAVPQPAHDRLPPAQGLRKAWHLVPRGACLRRSRRTRSGLTGGQTGDCADASPA
jgi:hypothetical protein